MNEDKIKEMQIPREIFLYWHQGWKDAPDLVKRCAETWTAQNPSWAVKFLDRDSVEKEIRIPFFVRSLNLPLPALSDVIRLTLLLKHGGVWADATLWCARPLDDWIDEVCQESGFFCYVHTDRPEVKLRSRLIGTWFLAAVPDSRIVSLWHAAAMRLMAKAKLSLVLGAFGEGFSSWLMPQLTGLSVPASDRLDDEHYFWVFRLFKLCLDNDCEFRKIWLSMPKVSSSGPHALARFGLLKPASMDALTHIQSTKANVYKLSRRISLPSDITGTLLDALYRSHPEVLSKVVDRE